MRKVCQKVSKKKFQLDEHVVGWRADTMNWNCYNFKFIRQFTQCYLLKPIQGKSSTAAKSKKELDGNQRGGKIE